MAMPAFGRERTRRWSASEVRQLIAESPLQTPRYELVGGELLVTPSPNRVHQLAVDLLWKALFEYLERYPVGRALTGPLDVELEPNTIVQPDDVVVPMGEWKRIAHEMPCRELLVAIEVLSPSSGRFDRVTKRELYQRHVSEYWIIDVDSRLFERWQPDDDRPRILVDELVWHASGADEPFQLDLPRYFARCFDE
jgi:Uma2 family endonuclease